MSADVLAQVETALAKLRRDDFPDREWPLWEDLQDALESLRALRATAVEGYARINDKGEPVQWRRYSTYDAGANVREAWLLPTPTAGTSPEHEEGAL